MAGTVLLLELLTANRYGYFGDEMYHMACGEHMAWGYVDQPPLIAAFATAGASTSSPPSTVCLRSSADIKATGCGDRATTAGNP
jgi:hypothetical protein